MISMMVVRNQNSELRVLTCVFIFGKLIHIFWIHEVKQGNYSRDRPIELWLIMSQVNNISVMYNVNNDNFNTGECLGLKSLSLYMYLKVCYGGTQDLSRSRINFTILICFVVQEREIEKLSELHEKLEKKTEECERLQKVSAKILRVLQNCF